MRNISIILFVLLLGFSFAFASPELIGAKVSYAHDGSHSYTILMTDKGFEPDEIQILTGDTIVFENVGLNDHWPASNIHPTHAIYPEFDPQQPIKPGEKWSFTFNKAGHWRMHDHLYPKMTGSIKATGENIGNVDDNVERKSIFARFISWFKMIFSREYYAWFPSRLEKRLSKTSIFEISEDDFELRYWLELAGSEKVMNRLLDESGGGYSIDCHQPAHQIGRVAFSVFGRKAFQDGDASCHSGFYHGAMEEFIRTSGTENLSSDISVLCNSFGTRFGIFECLHGVGHGVMAFENYDLHKALDDCRELKTEYEARSCYGGVFMENIVAGLGLGAIPDHETDWLSDDPYFPCNAVGDDYGTRYECYQMQTSRMLRLNGDDFGEVIRLCQGVDQDMIPVCFKSLGRDIAGHTLRKPDKIVELCDMVPRDKNYHSQCVAGAVNVIIDFWGPKITDQADGVCELLIPVEKNKCYELIKERKTGMVASD